MSKIESNMSNTNEHIIIIIIIIMPVGLHSELN
jgi:hypothetical protein